MRILPKNSMIFVQQEKVAAQSEGGIVLPESARKTADNSGVITHVSADVVGEGDYQVGQRVIFGEYAGAPIVIDGEVYMSIKECDVIAVLED